MLGRLGHVQLTPQQGFPSPMSAQITLPFLALPRPMPRTMREQRNRTEEHQYEKKDRFEVCQKCTPRNHDTHIERRGVKNYLWNAALYEVWYDKIICRCSLQRIIQVLPGECVVSCSFRQNKWRSFILSFHSF